MTLDWYEDDQQKRPFNLFLFLFCGARLKKYVFVSKYIKLLLSRTDNASDVFVAKGNQKRKKEFPN